MLISNIKHLLDSDVLFPTNVVDESFVVHAYHEAIANVGVGNMVELVLSLGEAPNEIAQAFLGLTLASQELPHQTRFGVRSLKVGIDFPLEVGPVVDGVFFDIVQLGSD